MAYLAPLSGGNSLTVTSEAEQAPVSATSGLRRRTASRQRAGVAVGANDDQIHAVICGKRQDDVGDRGALRQHLLYFDAGTVPREIQGDISAGLLAVPACSLFRIDNQKRHGASRDEEGERVCDCAPGLTAGVPADQYLVADRFDFQRLGMTRMGAPLESRSFSGDA